MEDGAGRKIELGYKTSLGWGMGWFFIFFVNTSAF